ncbi:carboxylesterase/lipase family protein [Xylanibacter oryzae]|uniref:carboxylesterase/lipase family protein n=1 Tax=Xylanibacter oryzae TaxID=185293 RepID=UPI0004B2A4F4|nr:carboxylesterase family protein [Xylanibacter oryzae]
MKKQFFITVTAMFLTLGASAQDAPQVQTGNGILEGINESGIKVFKGVPFAAPPVGDLRWKAPQPVQKWDGIRKADEFGPNPMQENVFGDMMFGTKKMSEDCLYLNIWTPAKTMDEKLPVFIYFNGGGLMAGSGSEPRYAGLSMARRGIVAITANYREGIFGFFAHPQLSKEASYKGSGNYGFLDQAAAIKWVKDNISAFGGDPDRITIMGESAGSMSVSALMASPLTRNLISQAMGSSGSVLGSRPIVTLKEAEQAGVETTKKLGCKSIKDLRALSADELMKRAAVKSVPSYNIDNYFFTEQPAETYAKGEQAQVPCLIGNNSSEMVPAYILQGKPATIENLKPVVEKAFNVPADKLLPMYGINTDADIMQLPGYQLAGDIFIAYSTWKWMNVQQQTCTKPVYRYIFCRPRPDMVMKNKEAGLAGGVQEKKSDAPAAPKIPGAIHSADIEYEMGNLSTNNVFAWNADDYAISNIFESYYANFIKTGNPNGLGLPEWTPINGQAVAPVMQIDVNTHLKADPQMESRYQLIDSGRSTMNTVKK